MIVQIMAEREMQKEGKMSNWKKELEQIVSAEYPGTTIKWNGDDPTLVIPDELENKAIEIVEYVTAL
jgi:hypothetical protein